MKERILTSLLSAGLLLSGCNSYQLSTGSNSVSNSSNTSNLVNTNQNNSQERLISLEGQLEVIVADDFDNMTSHFFYTLTTEEQRYNLTFESPLPYVSGIVRINGELRENNGVFVCDGCLEYLD